MKLIYRIALIIAGCYFEGAVRNATQLVLYWAGKPDALQGFVPYLVPVFFGYIYALDARNYWSENRLKNDVMAYAGSTILIGYPLLISLSLWFSGGALDPTTAKVRIGSTVLLLANLAIAALVWRGAVTRGFPVSLPWGGISGGNPTQEESEADVEEPEEQPEERPEEQPEEQSGEQPEEQPKDKPEE